MTILGSISQNTPAIIIIHSPIAINSPPMPAKKTSPPISTAKTMIFILFLLSNKYYWLFYIIVSRKTTYLYGVWIHGVNTIILGFEYISRLFLGKLALYYKQNSHLTKVFDVSNIVWINNFHDIATSDMYYIVLIALQ